MIYEYNKKESTEPTTGMLLRKGPTVFSIIGTGWRRLYREFLFRASTNALIVKAIALSGWVCAHTASKGR